MDFGGGNPPRERLEPQGHSDTGENRRSKRDAELYSAWTLRLRSGQAQRGRRSLHKRLTDECVRPYTINFGGIALLEELESRGGTEKPGNRGASEGGCRALFGWALRLRSGEDTPALQNF
jgi:hypothetical protein